MNEPDFDEGRWRYLGWRDRSFRRRDRSRTRLLNYSLGNYRDGNCWTTWAAYSQLAPQAYSNLVLRSVDAAIAAFSCLGFKFYDSSPITMMDVASSLLIKLANSEFILSSEAPHLFYSVLLSLSRVKLPKRRASWMRTFRRYEEILSGGGEEFFRLRHGEKTDSMTVFGGVCTLTMRA